MAKLITNNEILVSEVINKFLPNTANLDILVGYFYFSGLEQIYKNLADVKLRILVGMNIERAFSNRIKEFVYIDESNQSISRLQLRNDYFEGLVDLFNNSNYFDTKERQDAFRIFLSKIDDGSLEIKKTADPNHAKLYLFGYKPSHTNQGLTPGVMVTGSSNLTLSGLSNRQELNVLLHDEYEDGKAIFDRLWGEAIDLVTPGTRDNFYTEVIEKIWLDKLPSPYLMYVRLLLEYFEVEEEGVIVYPNTITKGRFLDLKYQKDAISKGISIINQHNGVLIADVVGLGKSIIASAIAYNLKRRVIIIASPGLHYQWDEVYSPLFHLNSKTFGPRSIGEAIKYHQNSLQGEEVVVIVDEAHNFRNEKSENYLLLHQLCQGNKVILLTATPFNNKPEDLFALIKLFQIPYRSTMSSVRSLSHTISYIKSKYDEIHKDYRQASSKKGTSTVDSIKMDRLGKELRSVLEPIIIRRSRLDIDIIEAYKKDLEKQKIKYVLAEPPVEKVYQLGDLAELYLKTLQRITPLSKKQKKEEEEQRSGGIEVPAKLYGARYKPVEYLVNRMEFMEYLEKQGVDISFQVFELGQFNLANLMMRFLASRFESSIESFKKTLDQLIKSMHIIRDYYIERDVVPIMKKGTIPLYTEINEKDFPIVEGIIEDLDDAESMIDVKDKSSLPKGLFFIPKEYLNDKFIEDLNSDIDLLTDIQTEWFGRDGERVMDDPKINHFTEEIKNELKKDPKRKIVVFSEFSDTVDYVHKKLVKDGIKAIKYTSKGSNLETDRIVRENFDASNDVQKDDYDVVVATDSLSEGWNLNRAGTVFNYDIPYNPTRVLQRVGRINRIGQMLFDKIYIYNYFPSDIGEREVQRKTISKFKKAIIDAVLGEDTQAITNEEELQTHFNNEFKKAQKQFEEESWDAKYRNELYILKQHHPEIIVEAEKLPHKSRIRRLSAPVNEGVILFGKKGKNYTFRRGISHDRSDETTAIDALELFKADREEKALKLSDNFEDIYQRAKLDMFSSLEESSKSSRHNQVINKINALMKYHPNDKEYLKELLYVTKDLNSLPDSAYTIIRNIDVSTFADDIKNLKEAVPQTYLAKIIKRANAIEAGTEVLILAEELTEA